MLPIKRLPVPPAFVRRHLGPGFSDWGLLFNPDTKP